MENFFFSLPQKGYNPPEAWHENTPSTSLFQNAPVQDSFSNVKCWLPAPASPLRPAKLQTDGTAAFTPAEN